MPRPRGRAFLHTDGGARDIDRLVEREVRLTYYPTGSDSDRPVDITCVGAVDLGIIRVIIMHRSENGSIYEKVVDIDLPTRVSFPPRFNP
jgi:hypothetical protein